MARPRGPKPGGKIWFIGGPLNNRLQYAGKWPKEFTVAAPLAIPAATCYGDEEFQNGPAVESVYYLSRLVSRENGVAAIFDCYVHESVTHDELVSRVYVSPIDAGGFVLHDFEIDRRLGAPKAKQEKKGIR